MSGPALQDEGSSRVALVTGGAGFIGSHLVAGLASAGFHVRVLDDLSTGREQNLAEAPDLVLHRADLCDRRALDEAMQGAELVFHHAAIASVPRSLSDPIRCHEVNLRGTLEVLEAARANGVRRVVLASSSAVYGEAATLPRREDQVPDPRSPYAVQKLACEHYARSYGDLHGLETVALRYFNVYGPRQDPASDYAAVLPLFVSALSRGDAVRMHGDGEQTRDFIYVEDAARATLLAGEAPEAAGRVINVASGRPTSVKELARAVARVCGRPLEEIMEPAREGDVRESWADVGLARQLLGFEPEVELAEGIRSTVRSQLAGYRVAPARAASIPGSME